MFHKLIRETGQDSGYTLDNGGICNGYTLGWVESMLVDEGHLFDATLQSILKQKRNLKYDIANLKERAKSSNYKPLEGDIQLFETAAFYERVELYQNAGKHYPGFFFKPISQINIDEISKIASSESVLNAGGLNTVFSHSYIFTLNELDNYLEALCNILSTLQVSDDIKNTGIIITNNSHIAGIIFNHEHQKWSWYMDIDDGHYAVNSTNELVNFKLGFSGQHELVLPEDEFRPEKGKIYIGKRNGSLLYAIRHPLSDIVFETIDSNTLSDIPGFPLHVLDDDNQLEENQIKPYLPHILNILSDRAHTSNTRFMSINIKVITLKKNIASETWRNRLAPLKNYQPLTNEVANRCGRSSLLQSASTNGHVEIVTSLLQYPDLDVNQNLNNQAALVCASTNGHVEVVAALLQRADISVNQREKDGATALFLAAQLGQLQVVKILLAHPKIQPTRALYDGLTALSAAAGNGHLDIVCELLPYFDINATSRNGTTPLIVAAQDGHIGVVNVLLRQPGIDVNAVHTSGATALYLAAQNRHPQVVRALLNHPNISVNIAVHEHGGTALSIAAQNGDIVIVGDLLNHPDIDSSKSLHNGSTPLRLATIYNHPDVADLLQAHNTRNKSHKL